jgi:hypothetical protein
MRVAMWALVLAAWPWAVPLARACSTCNSGDPTLTVTGVEQPYRNRLRIGLDELFGSSTSGDGYTFERSRTLTSSVGLSWSPLSRLTLAVVVPWVTRWIETQQSGRAFINGLGDAQISSRVVLFRNRAFAPQHLLWGGAGLKFPTAPRLRDDAGRPYSDDDQPGSGSWDPVAGLTYAWFGPLTSISVSVSYQYTTPGRHGYRFGSVLKASTALQLQPWRFLAVSLGFEARHAEADRYANHHAVPDTGGLLLEIMPALLFSPARDLLVRVGVGLPIFEKLRGIQTEAVQAVLSLSYDVY